MDLFVKTYITLIAPFGLLVTLAECTLEDDLLVFKFLDGLVLEWDDPFIRFLKLRQC